ncbi:hypothetical protein WR25_10996 isoform B [Diploscapter pachys]|uniref:Uncharacterized protein n=1 Tax=Diploscapter pachys TaxID=2018661 RepID=A0A2A2JEX9_9BILA|nr:hypothetical protein WR25_10996 isoform B [Diploscapter pachys]
MEGGRHRIPIKGDPESAQRRYFHTSSLLSYPFTHLPSSLFAVDVSNRIFLRRQGQMLYTVVLVAISATPLYACLGGGGGGGCCGGSAPGCGSPCGGGIGGGQGYAVPPPPSGGYAVAPSGGYAQAPAGKRSSASIKANQSPSNSRRIR